MLGATAGSSPGVKELLSVVIWSNASCPGWHYCGISPGWLMSSTSNPVSTGTCLIDYGDRVAGITYLCVVVALLILGIFCL